MNSQEAIQALQAFDETLASEIVGKQGIRDALAIAFSLLKDGYQADEERIATEVQKAITAEQVQTDEQ